MWTVVAEGSSVGIVRGSENRPSADTASQIVRRYLSATSCAFCRLFVTLTYREYTVMSL